MVEERKYLSAGVAVLVGLTMSGIAWAGDVGKSDGFDARVFAESARGAVVRVDESELDGLRGAGVLDDLIAAMIEATDGENTISYTIDNNDTVTDSGGDSLSASFSIGSVSVNTCSSGCPSYSETFGGSSGDSTSSFTSTSYSSSTSLNF